MDWSLAYLLWKLHAIQVIIGLGVAAFTAAIAVRMVRQYSKNYSGEKDFPNFVLSKRSHNRRVVALGICLGVTTTLLAALPTTEQIFKIAATKYAADAITSGTTREKLQRASNLVDDGMRVLHDKIKEIERGKE